MSAVPVCLDRDHLITPMLCFEKSILKETEMHFQTKFKALMKRSLLTAATLLLLPSIAVAGGKATLISNTESMQMAGQTIEGVTFPLN